MAKTGVFDSDPMVIAKVTEFKKELQKLFTTIVDDDDYPIHTLDQAIHTLSALKGLKMNKRSLSFKLRQTLSSCPDEFKCPLSKELMRDPVILATGQTYDRLFIQKWLKAGNRTCPLTQQVLSHTILTPNLLVREMISQWCKSRGFESPDPVHYVNEEGITEADRDHFLSLLEKMSLALPEQKHAARELRLLTKRMPSFRALFGESIDAIPQLLNPLSASKSGSGIHPDLQEDVITTLLNLSIHDNNKKLVAETPMVIPLLMEALRSGTIEIRTNAAAALFTLSALDSNKALIGKSGAIKPLIDLLEEGNPLAMKDVASAIFTLCFQRAVEEMGELGTVPCLLRIMRESICERNKENCIAILHVICFYDRTKWKAMREEENSYGTISKLARDGTSRAKRKANGILERLNRGVNLTHTA